MFGKKKVAKITCIGSVSQDIFFPNEEGVFVDTKDDLISPRKVQFPLGGKILVPDRFDDVGGVAANVSVGLSRLGHQTRIVSRIGDDSIATYIKEKLANDAVILDRLIALTKTPSDLSAILVFMQSGERTIFHNRDANEQLVVKKEDLVHSEWIFVSALNGDWKRNIETVLENQKILGFRIMLNPGQHNLKEDPLFMRNFLKNVEYLALNKDEALLILTQGEDKESVTADTTEEELLRALHKLGPKHIALTDGARGAWTLASDTVFHQEAQQIATVVDSTGAGDAFASAFFGALLHNEDPRTALAWGIQNSSSVILHYGATTGLLQKNDFSSLY